MFALTSSILSRTYKLNMRNLIDSQDVTATCVLIDYKEHQYLVTCKHYFADLQVEDGNARLGLARAAQDVSVPVSTACTGTLATDAEQTAEDTYTQYQYSFVGFGTEGADVMVLKLESKLDTVEDLYLPNQLESSFPMLGDEVGILGFPTAVPFGGDVVRLQSGGLVPAVQRGCLTYFGFGDSPSVYYLGIMNTEGFSGGPMFHVGENQQTTLLGIVKDRRTLKQQVLEKGEETPFYILENTGIMTATSVLHALEAIEKCSTG